VIRRNFDPVTQAPSSYVNDRLYTYAIQDPIPINGGASSYADAVEIPVDPTDSFTSVANAIDSIDGSQLLPGAFFTGLTRDDVGGLRYLYERKFANSYVENLVTNAVVSPIGNGGPWQPVVIGTNGLTDTNNFIITALRPGIDKFVFKLAPNTVFGNFIAFTNRNKDVYYNQNGRRSQQTYLRTMIQPDIIFAAGDLGLNAGAQPVQIWRSENFVNNAALNTSAPTGPTAGPGTITPTVFITFNKLGPFLHSDTPSFLSEQTVSLVGWVWGSFDGTTNDPVVYPAGSTIQDLQQIIFAP
jgi:hypothetical protein